jgi:SecD/SecF fusion protein
LSGLLKGPYYQLIFEHSSFKKPVQNINFDFVGARRKAYIFSATFILAGIIAMVAMGLNLGVDFKGGRMYIVNFDQAVSAPEVRSA